MDKKLFDELVQRVREADAMLSSNQSTVAEWIDICARLMTYNERLRAALGRSEKAIADHNDECQNMCGHGEQEAVRCQYRPYFENNGRRCPECPVYNKIDYERAADETSAFRCVCPAYVNPEHCSAVECPRKRAAAKTEHGR